MLRQWERKEADWFMPKTFAEILKELRDERKWTGVYLGEKAGIDQGLISKYETGERTPKAPNIHKIADAFGVDPKPLLMAAGRLSANDASPNLADPDAARLLDIYSRLPQDDKKVIWRVVETIGAYRVNRPDRTPVNILFPDGTEVVAPGMYLVGKIGRAGSEQKPVPLTVDDVRQLYADGDIEVDREVPGAVEMVVKIGLGTAAAKEKA